MSAHQCPNTTPGPWYNDGGGIIYVDTRERVCCNKRADPSDGSCCGHPDIIGGYFEVAQTSAADGNLIAAAPLMYEALANLENDGGKNMPPLAWKLVQDALQAARGKVE